MRFPPHSMASLINSRRPDIWSTHQNFKEEYPTFALILETNSCNLVSSSYQSIKATMADIAMLVAEEYERRMKKKNSRRLEEDDQRKLSFVPSFSIMPNKMNVPVWGKDNDKHWVLEPRSQISLAASDCFFSA